MSELTQTINTRLAALKAKVNTLPTGGGLERLNLDLSCIESEIQRLKEFLAEKNQE